MGTVSELEQKITAKANEAAESIRHAYGAIQRVLAEDVPQYAAMAAAVEQDPLVSAAMRAVLPSTLRTNLAAMLEALAADEQIQAAARAEHTAAAPADPTAPEPATAPSTATADAVDQPSSDPAGTLAPPPPADPYAAA